MKLIAVMVLLLSGCARAQQPTATAQRATGEKKVLIVHLSRTNNTKTIAEFIHEKVGGTLVALELERPYPADYNATVQQVARENETGYLPPLQTRIDRIARYGAGSSFQTVRELCARCTVRDGFVTRGGVERDGQYLTITGARAEEVRQEVESWLRKIEMETQP